MNDPLEMTAAYLEGKLNEAQVAELEAWLGQDRDRAKVFVRQAMIDSHLGELLHEQNVEDVAVDLSDDSQFGELLQALDVPDEMVELVRVPQQAPVKRPQIKHVDTTTQRHRLDRRSKTIVIPKAVFYGGIAATLLLALLIGWSFTSLTPAGKVGPQQPLANVPPQLPDPPAVATLTAERDAQWQDSSGITLPKVGDRLRPGQSLILTHGFAELTTSKGAVAVLEAPCAVELIDSPNALRLVSGKLVGEVPERAHGFTVRTPGIDVVDLGTVFGVEVEDGGTAVEVFEGSVVVGPDAWSDQTGGVTVQSGQTATSNDPATILVTETPQGQTRFAHHQTNEQLHRWLAYRDQLMRDPSLVAYYTFEGPTDGMLLESRGGTQFDGAIEGAKWVDGRFPGKRGLRFAGPGSGNRVELSPNASSLMNFPGSFTIAVWFKAEPFTSKWQSIITKGESSWRLQSNTMWKLHPQHGSDQHEPSALNFGHDDISGEMAPGLPGRTPVDDGVWRQVVVVFDAKDNLGIKHLYINGVSDATPQQVPLLKASPEPVWIGGNADLPKGREFLGVIDEVAIFKRALTPLEVNELYQGGAPEP